MSGSSDLERNRVHYDRYYEGVDIDAIVGAVRDLDTFLPDAVRTHASWIGLYHGGLQHRLSGRRVLEMGAGDGLNALVMAALGARVLAVDISEVSPRIVLEAARRAGLQDRVEARAGDLASMDLGDEPFDFVIGKAILHHLPHDVEDRYLARAAEVLDPSGEARFFEPATNSAALDALRWIVPVPGRPSILQRRAFARWKEEDPHPERDNSSTHYRHVGLRHFAHAESIPMGGIARLYRLLPDGRANLAFRRAAHRLDMAMPGRVQNVIARAQTIIYREPRRGRSLDGRHA